MCKLVSMNSNELRTTMLRNSKGWKLSGGARMSASSVVALWRTKSLGRFTMLALARMKGFVVVDSVKTKPSEEPTSSWAWKSW
jgi:hypothetical protein